MLVPAKKINTISTAAFFFKSLLLKTNLLTELRFFADHWNKPELLWSNHYKFLEVFVYVFSSGHLYTCSILQLQELCNQDLKIRDKLPKIILHLCRVVCT